MKKVKIDILFFVEHVAREMDVACIAICYLKRVCPGIKVKVISGIYRITQNIKKYDPRIVITPYCYSQNSYLFRFLIPEYGTSIKYINLAYEEICSDLNIPKKLPRDTFSKKRVYHIVWSKSFAEKMIEKGTLNENIFVNGNPNFSLYYKPFNNIFEKKKKLAKKYGLNPSKKWIFIPGNFGPTFWTDNKKKRKLDDGFSQDFIDDYISFSSNTFKSILEWLSNYPNRSQCEFILRPKPSVSLKKYKNKVRTEVSDSSINIIKSYSIRDWILASDIVLSNLSTSLLDAAVAGKKIAMLEPLILIDEYKSDWQKYTTHIQSQDEFNNFLNYKGDFKSEGIENWLGSYTNKNALFELADIIKTVLEKPTQTHMNINSPEVVQNPSLSTNLKYIVKSVMNFFGLLRDNDFFSDLNVRRKIRHWQKVIIKNNK